MILNEVFLCEIYDRYEVVEVKIFNGNFTTYQVKKNKRNIVYLMLFDNDKNLYDVNMLLNKISSWDNISEYGKSYLCIIPTNDPIPEMCTYFNGKSFVHFIFVNKKTNLIYDKKIHYLGSKIVMELMDIYQTCFDNWKKTI